MKALLLKDYFVAKKYLRAFSVMLIVFLAVGAMNPDMEYYLSFPCVLSGILTVSLVSYDERFHWDSYCELLPLPRKTVVAEKYVLTLIIGLTVWLISDVIEAFRVPVTSPAYLTMVFGRLAVTLAAPVILLPVIFKYGVEKGRIVYFIVLGFFTAASAMIFPQSAADVKGVAPALTWVILPVVAALYALSWLLSVKVYEKREF